MIRGNPARHIDRLIARLTGTFGVSVGLMILSAAVAALIPASRAARLDPVKALRVS